MENSKNSDKLDKCGNIFFGIIYFSESEPKTLVLSPRKSVTKCDSTADKYISQQQKETGSLKEEEPDLINLDSKKNSPELKTKITITPPISDLSTTSITESPKCVLLPVSEENWDNISKHSVDSLDSYVHPKNEDELVTTDAGCIELSGDQAEENNVLYEIAELEHSNTTAVFTAKHDYISENADFVISTKIKTKTFANLNNLEGAINSNHPCDPHEAACSRKIVEDRSNVVSESRIHCKITPDDSLINANKEKFTSDKTLINTDKEKFIQSSQPHTDTTNKCTISKDNSGLLCTKVSYY